MTRAQGVALALLAGLLSGDQPDFGEVDGGAHSSGYGVGTGGFCVGLFDRGNCGDGQTPSSVECGQGVATVAFLVPDILGALVGLIMIAFLETSAGNAAMLGSLTPFFFC